MLGISHHRNCYEVCQYLLYLIFHFNYCAAPIKKKKFPCIARVLLLIIIKHGEEREWDTFYTVHVTFGIISFWVKLKLLRFLGVIT